MGPWNSKIIVSQFHFEILFTSIFGTKGQFFSLKKSKVFIKNNLKHLILLEKAKKEKIQEGEEGEENKRRKVWGEFLAAKLLYKR